MAATNNQLHPHFAEGEKIAVKNRKKRETAEFGLSELHICGQRAGGSHQARGPMRAVRPLTRSELSYSPSLPSALEEKRTQSPVS